MSTIEAAICFSGVFLVICALIVLPANLCLDAKEITVEAIEDVASEDDGFLSAERFNTLLTGLSENYRIIYSGLVEAVSGDGQ